MSYQRRYRLPNGVVSSWKDARSVPPDIEAILINTNAVSVTVTYEEGGAAETRIKPVRSE